MLEGWARQPGLSVSLSVHGRRATDPLTLERDGPFELKAPVTGRGLESVPVDLVLAGEEPAPGQGIVMTGLRFE